MARSDPFSRTAVAAWVSIRRRKLLELGDALGGEGGDGGAAVGDPDDEAFALELADGLTDGSAGDAELFGKLDLVDGVAGGHAAIDDGFAHGAEHESAEGFTANFEEHRLRHRCCAP